MYVNSFNIEDFSAIGQVQLTFTPSGDGMSEMVSHCFPYRQMKRGCYAVARIRLEHVSLRLYGNTHTTIPPSPYSSPVLFKGSAFIVA